MLIAWLGRKPAHTSPRQTQVSDGLTAKDEEDEVDCSHSGVTIEPFVSINFSIVIL